MNIGKTRTNQPVESSQELETALNGKVSQGSVYFVSGYVADVDDNQYQIPFQPYLALSEGETYLPQDIEGFFGLITGNNMDYRFVMRKTEGLTTYGDLSIGFSYGEITIRALDGTIVATITA